MRRSSAHLSKHEPGYFDPDTLTGREAGDLWHRCMKQIDENLRAGKAVAGLFKVRDQVAQLHFLVNRNGHLERFWLRLALGNTLVIVGCRRGLLPLAVEALNV